MRNICPIHMQRTPTHDQHMPNTYQTHSPFMPHTCITHVQYTLKACRTHAQHITLYSDARHRQLHIVWQTSVRGGHRNTCVLGPIRCWAMPCLSYCDCCDARHGMGCMGVWGAMCRMGCGGGGGGGGVCVCGRWWWWWGWGSVVAQPAALR